MRGWIMALCVSVPMLAQAANHDIFDAARAGDGAAIARYVAAGGDVEARNDRGYTPFILAAYHNQRAAAEQLKKAGADACAVDAQGSDALMGVAFKGHQAMAEWLLAEGGCDVNHRNANGQTALMMAALFGREEIITRLLAAGADPSIADARGNTAASLAEGQGLTHLANLLRFLRP